MAEDKIEKPVAYIHQWRVYGQALIGKISDHPRQADFQAPWQITSPVISVPPEGLVPGTKIETYNTVYILGRKFKREPDGKILNTVMKKVMQNVDPE